MECAQARRPTGCGFTLIELLIVVGILAALMGMLMPMLRMADRLATASATRSVMAKVDIAARLFRADIGAYPYQRTYADPLTGGAMPNWSNRLYWHLGTQMTDAQMTNVRKDADDAAARYNAVAVAPNNFAFNDRMLDRMAAERARMMLYSGNLDATGPTVITPPPVVSSGKLVPSPVGQGWADDYLGGELEKRYIDGEQVLDAWKKPLIYVCQVTEGVCSALTMTGLSSNSLPAKKYGLQPLGRISLAARDALTGTVLVPNPPYLPDPTNLRKSDRRKYAAPTWEAEFELWSAGRDGLADWMRDAQVNADNVSLVPYDKHLP